MPMIIRIYSIELYSVYIQNWFINYNLYTIDSVYDNFFLEMSHFSKKLQISNVQLATLREEKVRLTVVFESSKTVMYPSPY